MNKPAGSDVEQEAATRNYWAQQTSSLHRRDSDGFFAAKAIEHAGYFSESERKQGVCDIGCGDGRLLAQLSSYVSVPEAFDFSESMIPIARTALVNKPTKVFHADALDYLAESPRAIWMSTAGVNQYFSASQMERLLELYFSRAQCTSLFLFDTIDPLRYPLLGLGAWYDDSRVVTRDQRKPVPRWRHGLLSCVRVLRASLQSDPVRLPSASMGYGYKPGYWWRAIEGAPCPIELEIVSSRYYEYRYHVFLRKITSPAT